MTATMLVLEPIFEADLQPEQYAYRQERSAFARGPTRSSTAEIAALAGDRCGFVRLLRSFILMPLSTRQFMIKRCD